jgi:nucleoside-diphosphate-sugar epimerase
MQNTNAKLIADSPQIVGRGMIAKAFSRGLLRNRSLVVYASGVSDSDCAEHESFERERALLKTTLSRAGKEIPFIYFSTCSVYDPDVSDRPYVRHKQAMEALVLSHSAGLVVRLPQVAGPNAAPNTLLAYLVFRIREGHYVQVWDQAVRNLVDVEDVVRIVEAWLTLPLPADRVLNVANPKSIKVTELVQIIESALGLVAKVKRVSKGASYHIDTQPMLAAAAMAQVDFGNDYLHRLIRKYFA